MQAMRFLIIGRFLTPLPNYWGFNMLQRSIYILFLLLFPISAFANCTTICDAQGNCHADCPSTNPDPPPQTSPTTPPNSQPSTILRPMPNPPRQTFPRQVFRPSPQQYLFRCHTRRGICTFTLSQQLQIGTPCYCSDAFGQRLNGRVFP